MNRAVAPPPQRQDKPQHVNIVTIGLHLIDRWFELHMLQPSRAARSIMSRYAGFQDDRTLHILIHEMLQFLEIPSSPAYMTSVDCRQFHDPDRCRGINHVGYNAEIIERIVNHGTFDGVHPKAVQVLHHHVAKLAPWGALSHYRLHLQ